MEEHVVNKVVKDESVLSAEVKQCMQQIRLLRNKKSNLKAEVQDIDNTLGDLNVKVTDFFESHKIQNMTIKGVGMFYLNRQLYPSIEDHVQCHAWLKKEGDFDMMLSFNTNKFKAYYKERLENKQPLPEGVRQFFKTDVRVRKA